MTCQLTPMYPSQAAVPAEPLPLPAPVENQPPLSAAADAPQEPIPEVALLHAPDAYGLEMSRLVDFNGDYKGIEWNNME